jgi:hypothetical protein
MLAARTVASPPNPLQQPHIEVAVQATGGSASKWEDGKPAPTKGHMMIDTGAAVTLVTTKWASDHGLRVNDGKKLSIRGAGGGNVKVLGTTAFTVQLTPTLEVDLADVIVSEGDFYQCLLGGDILGGKPRILGAAQIIMSSHTTVGNV